MSTASSPYNDHLDTLETLGLIRLAGLEPDIEYMFRHTMVQQATYDSLLRRDRRVLHQAVGEALEQFYEEPGSLAPELAHHFSEAGEPHRALPYAILAADRAFQQYANREAIIHYSDALGLMVQIEDTPAQQVAHVYRRRGRAFELRGEYHEAQENYHDLLEEGEERGDESMVLAALTALATIFSTPTVVQNPHEAVALSERALTLAQSLGDHSAEARVLWNLGLAHMYGLGDSAGAIDFMERSLTIARPLGLEEQIAFILTDLGNLYILQGPLDRGLERLREARTRWQKLGNIPMLALALNRLALVTLAGGDLQGGLSLGKESFAIAASIHNKEGMAYGLGNQSLALMGGGELGLALDTLEQAYTLGEESGAWTLSALNQAFAAELLAHIGDCENAIAQRDMVMGSSSFQSMEQTPRRQFLRFFSVVDALCGKEHGSPIRMDAVGTYEEDMSARTNPVLWFGAVGSSGLLQEDPEKALEAADQGIAVTERLGFSLRTIPCLLNRASALLALGRNDEAYDTLTTAEELAASFGEKLYRWRILATLAEIEEGRGLEDDAHRHRQEARLIVEAMASTLPNTRRRQMLLGLPAVRALLQRGTSA